MTINQVVDILTSERQKHLPHRFHCRVIMVRNISDYCKLLEKLREIDGTEFVPSSVLFSGPDVMPRYEKLKDAEFDSRWMILTGVSEYLRLFSRNEAQTQRFAKLWGHHFPASSTGRIIIPLWGCEAQWHDQALHLNDERDRKENCYFDCTDESSKEQELNITVLADTFRKYKDQFTSSDGVILDGLKEWHEYWVAPSPTQTNLTVITGRMNSVQQAEGSISIRVVQDTLSFIRQRMKGGKLLTADDCPEEAQRCLFSHALKGMAVDEAILKILNVGDFSSTDVMGKWNVLTTGQKELVRLWYVLHPDESYLNYCLMTANELADVENCIMHESFQQLYSHSNWASESRNLMDVMKIQRDDLFFKALDQIPNYQDRLVYLTGSSQQERSYLLHMVGLWLREDEQEVYENKELQAIYPALFAYLNGDVYDENLRRYMKLYKMYKLANTLPTDELTFFACTDPEEYYYRYTVLHDSIDEESIVLWIDALGVEWMPLLLWALKKRTEGKIRGVHVGQANLPAETEFNKQWEKMPNQWDKLDKLDKLTHKGVVDDPNYYTCVEEQIEFVTQKIIKRVLELLRDYHRVIITGDHGASRLAARFFHKRDGAILPKGAQPLNHGRYALIPSGDIHPDERQVFAKDDAGNKYLVFKNYDHFTIGGFAAGSEDDDPVYGEVHGGASPEEMLVPIIVFESTQPIPLKAAWKHDTVKITMKKAKTVISFSKAVKSLEVRIGDKQATTSPVADGKEWAVVFQGIAPAKYDVTIAADGKLVSITPLTILPPSLVNAGGDFD